MLVSRALLVVFKTTGGKRWNPRDGLKPLSKTQQQTRKANIEQTLKNMSVLKLAAAHEPDVPTRLYKPLTLWKINWMRKKLELAKKVLGWEPTAQQQQLLKLTASKQSGSMALQRMLPQAPAVAFEARVQDLAARLQAAQLEPGSARQQLNQ